MLGHIVVLVEPVRAILPIDYIEVGVAHHLHLDSTQIPPGLILTLSLLELVAHIARLVFLVNNIVGLAAIRLKPCEVLHLLDLDLSLG